jgi:non-heme chloroperoxidase
MMWRGILLSVLPLALAVPAATRAKPAITIVRSADGTDLLVAQQGDPHAPGILMIHGFGQSYLSFRRQFDSDLAKHYHLVAFDLRGHGGSAKPSDPAAYVDIGRSADDVAAVIAATGLERPVIVGWSYGGVVVGDLGALVKPMSAASLSPQPSGVVAALKAAAADARSMELEDNIAGGEVISKAYRSSTMTDADAHILFATEMMLPAYVRRAMIGRPYDNSDQMPLFEQLPTLFVRGEYDLGMGERELAELALLLPKMRLSRYAGLGHLTFFEAPDRFNAELAAFASAVTSARASDPAATIPRPTLPMSAGAHRAFRDQEFAARDRNHDGQLDAAELEAVTGHAMSADAVKQAMQLNCGSDGPVCTLAAYRRHGDAEFRRVDLNRDGVVTADELKAAGGSFHTATGASATPKRTAPPVSGVRSPS